MKPCSTLLLQELLLTILVRLPTKSLMRCKVVSKSWFSLISSNDFIYFYLDFNKHRHQKLIYGDKQLHFDNTPIRAMLFCDRQGIDQDLGAYFPRHQNNICHHYGISGPVNGMYCVYLNSINASSNFSVRDIGLWNPIAGKFHLLPKLDTAGHLYISSCGIAFHSLVNDYKVLVVTTDESTPRLRHSFSCLGIYSFATDAWKTLGVSPKIPWIDDVDFDLKLRECSKRVGPGGGFFFNEACNWYYSYQDEVNKECKYHCIASFHMDDEVFRVYKMPQAIDQLGHRVHQLTSLDNSLALVCSAHESPSIFDVWVMREFGVESSWSKIHSIATQGNISRYLGVVNEEFFFQDEENGQFVFYYLFSPNKGCYEYFSLPVFREVLPYSTSV